MKKYIVDNQSSQSITGHLVINGGLTASDATIDGSLVVKGGLTVVDENFTTLTYRALLTQTGPIVATNSSQLDGRFIVGETYNITDYVADDDFSNIANVINGTINTTGCTFSATGEIPNVWTNGSTITSAGDIFVNVLENTLGYDLQWEQHPEAPLGIYVAFDSNLGPRYNNFPKDRTSITVQETGYFFESDNIRYYPGTKDFFAKDDTIGIDVRIINYQSWTQSDWVGDRLYLTPVEIKIKQNIDKTPILVPGMNVVDYSIESSIDVVLYNSDDFVEYFTTSVGIANNVTELATLLNNDEGTNFLGVFSVDGEGGLELSMYANTVERFNTYGTLSFFVTYS
jgi:hypothetical protein